MDKGTSIKVNDFIWAKFAKYPPWPAIVMEPDPRAPPKIKNAYWVYFFGSHDYAWVEEKKIKPFMPFREQFKATYKQTSLVEAVEEIEEIIDNVDKDSDYEIDFIKYEPKERRSSSSRSRKSSDSSVEKKRQSRSQSKSSSRKRSRSSLSIDTDSDRADSIFIDDINNPMSISPKTFGFLAANICDEGIIKNLIKSGHRTQIWSSSLAMCEELQDYADRQEAYFKICRTRRELVRNCDIIFNHQTDPDQVKSIIKEFGVFDDNDNLLDGKGYVEMSNVDPDTSAENCKLIENKGGTYIEALLQGGLTEANRGELVVISAGKVPPFTECQSCFKAIGKTAILLGNVRAASKAQMLLESLRGILLAGFTEVFALADKWGLGLDNFGHILDLTSMSNSYLKSKLDIILEKKYTETEEPIQVIQRNLSLARHHSNQLRHPTPLTANANEIFKHARRLGCDNQDSASIYNRTRY